MAYEASLREVSRRRKYIRKIESEYKKLKKYSLDEKNQRKNFFDSWGRIMPEKFIPLLKEPQTMIDLSGKLREFDLPEIESPDHYSHEDEPAQSSNEAT